MLFLERPVTKSVLKSLIRRPWIKKIDTTWCHSSPSTLSQEAIPVLDASFLITLLHHNHNLTVF